MTFSIKIYLINNGKLYLFIVKSFVYNKNIAYINKNVNIYLFEKQSVPKNRKIVLEKLNKTIYFLKIVLYKRKTFLYNNVGGNAYEVFNRNRKNCRRCIKT